MQESTVPIMIPSWDEYPEILPALHIYERGKAHDVRTDAVLFAEVNSEPAQSRVANSIKISFLRNTTRCIPVPHLASRLCAWWTKDVTEITLGQENIEELGVYAAYLGTPAGEHVLLLSYAETLFCQANKLIPFLPVVEELIEVCFQKPLEVATELMKDPEAEGEWLLINVKVDADIDAVLDMYDEFTREWVERVPWPQREKIVVDYSIIDNV